MKRGLVISMLTGVGLGFLLLVRHGGSSVAEPPTETTATTPSSSTRPEHSPDSALARRQLPPPLPHTRQVPASRAQSWSTPVPEPAFSQFARWTQRYLNQPSSEAREALEIEGQELARLRRQDLTELIPADPKRALELAIPRGLRNQLPASITPFSKSPWTAEAISGYWPGFRPRTTPAPSNRSTGRCRWVIALGGPTPMDPPCSDRR